MWAFGSRVTGTARKFSDLDLAIDAGREISFLEMANLWEEFQESDLPMNVDLVDLHMVRPAFRKLVKAKRVLVQEADPVLVVPPASPKRQNLL